MIITKKIFKTLLKEINSSDPSQRKRKFSTKYVLKQVLYVLQSGIPWSMLTNLKCHPSTIIKRHNKWASLNIFEKLYNNSVQQYGVQCLQKDPLHFKNIFIDCSMIKSKEAIKECTGYNHYDRFRKATKLSCIVDKECVPISSVFYPANISDLTTLEGTLNNIQCQLTNDKRFHTNVIADKGYVCGEEMRRKMFKRKMNLVHETRVYKNKVVNVIEKIPTINKNGAPRKKRITKKPKALPKTDPGKKRKFTKAQREALAKRTVIEHLFCRLDKFPRLHFRSDKLLSVFSSFIILHWHYWCYKN